MRKSPTRSTMIKPDLLILILSLSAGTLAQAPAKVASPSTISYVVANPNAGQQMDDYAAGTLGAQMDDGTVQQQQQQYANPLPVQKANGAEMVLPPEPTPISAAGIAPAGSEYSSYGTIAKGQPSAEQQQQEIAPLPTLNNDALTNNSNDNKRATQGTTTVQEGGAINDPGKRRQWISPALAAPEPFVGGVPLPPGNGFAVAPAGPLPPVPPPPPGTCPGGASLPIECDPKRPWPQCPPQSYCFATNTVDIGPYFCCPIWSTYGAAWRPATPFYNYVPPPPPNWPDVFRAAAAPWPPAAVGFPPPPFRKSKKEQRFDDQDPSAALSTDDQKRIVAIMNDWMQRQQVLEQQNPAPNKA